MGNELINLRRQVMWKSKWRGRVSEYVISAGFAGRVQRNFQMSGEGVNSRRRILSKMSDEEMTFFAWHELSGERSKCRAKGPMVHRTKCPAKLKMFLHTLGSEEKDRGDLKFLLSAQSPTCWTTKGNSSVSMFSQNTNGTSWLQEPIRLFFSFLFFLT